MAKKEISDITNIDYKILEAYRQIKINIKLHSKELKTIAVTSAKPMEGKSTVALNLAKTIAESGDRVVFVDGDMRKSKIADIYLINDPKNGLQEYLQGEAKVEEIIFKDPQYGIDVILSGLPTEESTALLDGENLDKLIGYLKERYKYIILDTPSFMGIADASILINKCDGAILVIEENKVTMKEEAEAVDRLKNMKAEIVGAVLNKATIKDNINKDVDYYKV
jgi:capsular exopolysaccharide synthesis family protein